MTYAAVPPGFVFADYSYFPIVFVLMAAERERERERERAVCPPPIPSRTRPSRDGGFRPSLLLPASALPLLTPTWPLSNWPPSQGGCRCRYRPSARKRPLGHERARETRHKTETANWSNLVPGVEDPRDDHLQYHLGLRQRCGSYPLRVKSHRQSGGHAKIVALRRPAEVTRWFWGTARHKQANHLFPAWDAHHCMHTHLSRRGCSPVLQPARDRTDGQGVSAEEMNEPAKTDGEVGTRSF